MGRVAVLGSGPTGLAAAGVLLRAGQGVELIDASGAEPGPGTVAAPHPPPPGGAFRGELPAELLRKRIFGSDFVFAGVDEAIPLDGPWLPRSRARGGLANVWGAGCYPLRPEDHADWPVAPEALARWYGPAAELLHVSGSEDGLSAAYGPAEGLLPVAARDPGSPFEALLADWRPAGAGLAAQGLHAGRSRLAVRPASAGADGCQTCGRCLEGCPVGAVWNGRAVLEDLKRRGLAYRPGMLVRRWQAGDGAIWLEHGEPGGEARRLGPYDSLFLAAGPLSSFRIAAQSLGVAAEARLVENEVVVLPMLFRAGLTHGPRNFTLSEAAIAIDPAGALTRPAHLQLYRPGGATLGPVSALLARLPGPLRGLAERQLARLALGMLFLHGAQSRALRLRVDPGAAEFAPISVQREGGDPGVEAIRAALARLAGARRALGLRPLAPFRRRGGPGFSAHLGGALPMRVRPGRLECDADGRLAGAGEAPVFVADLSVFPQMPAQNPTLTGVANAMRIAAGYAGGG